MPETKLVVNAEGPEVRVGIIEDGTLVELFLERKRDRGLVGNIYKGRIRRVLPGMQAAFVDLGPTVEKNAYLYVADILGAGDERRLFEGYDSGGDGDGEKASSRSKNGASRTGRSRKNASSRKIEDLVKANQEILVQIAKDPVGDKGARVTGYVSLPGRLSVLMPAVGGRVGVSRRIASDAERRRLREVVDPVRPQHVGLIVRTAAAGAPEDALRDDVEFLVKLWGEIGARAETQKAPCLVYAELDMVLRSIRDLLRDDVAELLIDSEEQYLRARKFATAFLPRLVDRIKHYDGVRPIFDEYGIETALREATGRRVPLKSGGSLIIDQGEALTAIDINTGRFVGKKDLETTITKNNLEACQEVARQLRLRNLGGIIVVDFVDMDQEENRRKVWDAFNAALAHDRSRANVTKISELGLVEMTRKRTRESLNQVLTESCPNCGGTGAIKSATTLAYEILRETRRLGSQVSASHIVVECQSEVEKLLNGRDREFVDDLEKRLHKKVDVRASADIEPGHYRVAGKDDGQEDDPTKKPRPTSRRRPRASAKGASRGSRGRAAPAEKKA